MAHLRSCCLAILCLPTCLLPADVASGAGARAAVPAIPAPGGPATAGGAVVPAAPLPTAPPPAPPPDAAADIGGDRADAIARDSVVHPPQRPGTKGAAALHTIEMKLDGLLDRSVHGTENSEVGRVIDVLVRDDGRPAALELDVGGFMGVGNRKIAVAWSLFDIAKPGGEPLHVALSESQVKSAPAAEGSGPVAVVTGVDAPVPVVAEAKAGAEPAAAPRAMGPAAAPAGASVAAPAQPPPSVPAVGLPPQPVLVPPPVTAPEPEGATTEPGGPPAAAAPDATGHAPRPVAPPSGRR